MPKPDWRGESMAWIVRRVALELRISAPDAKALVDGMGGQGWRLLLYPTLAAALTGGCGGPVVVEVASALGFRIGELLLGDRYSDTARGFAAMLACGAGLLLVSRVYDYVYLHGLRRNIRRAAERVECVHCGYYLRDVVTLAPSAHSICPECGNKAIVLGSV